MPTLTRVEQQSAYDRLMTMQKVTDDVPVDESAALSAAAAMFRSLGDPNRLAILRHLALGEHRVRDLTDHLGLAQSTVSQHCLCLADCGLISSRPHGRATLYSLARPELLGVLAAAEKLLAATGDAVALCPTYGKQDA
jgi:DNA-binding transcriptional ArsR family regulator